MERRQEEQWRGKKEGNEVRNAKRKVKRSKKEDSKGLRGKSQLTSAEKDEECKGRRGRRGGTRGKERRILVREQRSIGREEMCLVKWNLG